MIEHWLAIAFAEDVDDIVANVEDAGPIGVDEDLGAFTEGHCLLHLPRIGRVFVRVSEETSDELRATFERAGICYQLSVVEHHGKEQWLLTLPDSRLSGEVWRP